MHGLVGRGGDGGRRHGRAPVFRFGGGGWGVLGRGCSVGRFGGREGHRPPGARAASAGAGLLGLCIRIPRPTSESDSECDPESIFESGTAKAETAHLPGLVSLNRIAVPLPQLEPAVAAGAPNGARADTAAQEAAARRFCPGLDRLNLKGRGAFLCTPSLNFPPISTPATSPVDTPPLKNPRSTPHLKWAVVSTSAWEAATAVTPPSGRSSTALGVLLSALLPIPSCLEGWVVGGWGGGGVRPAAGVAV